MRGLTTVVVGVYVATLLASCAALIISLAVAGGGSVPNPAGALLPGAAAAVIIVVAGALFIASRLSPLKNILRYVRAVAKGETAFLDPTRCGGLAPLALSLKEMIEASEGQAHWYESILNTLPISVSVTDMDMNWTFCNTASLKSMGKNDQCEVRGKHCSEKKGNLCKTPQCGIEQLRQGNKTVINHMPNGKTMRLMLDFLHDSSGKRIGHVEIGEDITEQIRLQEESRVAEARTKAALVEQLEGVAATLDRTAATLNHSVSEVKDQAGLAASRLAEAATAMNEMNSTVLEVANNAEGAAGAAASVREQAEDGNGLVLKTIESLHEVRQQSIGLKTEMEGLDRQSRDIGTVLTLIRDIADQTNLLALNAAIEAARAGEAGRGFAVVADSVRQLAEKTMSATSEVESAIKTIQQSTDKSASTVENAVSAVEEAGRMGEESGRSLQQISALAEDSSSRVAAIATAATEQSAASEEINRNLSELNHLSADIASAMEESASLVQEMADQSHVLMGILDSIRTQKETGAA